MHLFKRAFLLITLYGGPLSCVQAQNVLFLNEGRIEFECKFNLYSLLDENDTKTPDIKKDVPQFKVTYFDLLFKNNKTLYVPGRPNPENNKLSALPAEENIVYSILDQKVFQSQKKVFGETFLIQDSIRQVTWRITGEKRTIAGFECKRANAIIMDSVYAVVFYTEEILTQGGPESFSGLPGMILGVVLPHEHITWFATRVYSLSIDDANMKVSLKGKKSTNARLKEYLENNFPNWGKYASFYRRRILL